MISRRARRLARLSLFVMATAAWPSASQAQAPNGPFSQLFGREPDRTGKEFTAIEFRTSGGAEWDSGLFLDTDKPATDALQDGISSGVDMAGAIARKTNRTNLRTNARASYQEYFTEVPFGATSYDAALSFVANATNRVQVSTDAYYARSPFFHMLPPSLAGRQDWEVPVAAQPFAARLLINDTVDGRAGLSYQATKRTSFTISGVGRTMRFPEEPEHGYEMVGGEAGLKHRLNRDLSLHFWYGRDNFHLREPGADRYVHEYLDLGVDFVRDISLARRTSIGFSTQTAVLREADGPRKYRLNGSVTLTKWFQRTWHASVVGQRSTDFLPGFLKPIYSDTANASIGGMLNTRTYWYVVGGGGVGYVGSDAPQRFQTATAVSRINVGVTRRFGFYTQYSLYYYGNLDVATSAIPLARQLTRQTVTMGLNVWVPVYSKVTVPRGPQ